MLTSGRQMAPQRRRNRFQGQFNLGGEQAEADPLLELAFVETGGYSAMESVRDPRCFVVARTGSGKSAALQHLQEKLPEHVIRVTPEDLSLPYVTDLQVFRFLESLGVNLDLFFIALWKHVLLVELIRHRYHIDSPNAKQNFITNLRQRIARDPAKVQALAYLEEFEGKFWCEADERVRDITTSFEKTIAASASGAVGHPGFGVAAGGSIEAVSGVETRTQSVDRYQRIVNQFQLARLNKMIAVLDEHILDSPQHQTYVVIDDLDRDWVDEAVANDLIRCLFRTVLDLKRVKHLKVLVALRTTIFEQLDFSHSRSGQEEKLRSLILNLKWTRPAIYDVLDARAKAASVLSKTPQWASIDAVLPNANKTRGRPTDYILDRTLMRPRDAIAYTNQCIEVASGTSRVTWNVIHDAERAYSEGRLLALRDEWKASHIDLDKALRVFSGVTTPLTRPEFTKVLHDVMLLPADETFRGVAWLTDLSSVYWTADLASEEWFDLYYPLTRLLYAIGFIGCARAASQSPTYSFDDPTFVDHACNLGEEARFHLHPAFCVGLDIKDQRAARAQGIEDEH